MILMSDNSDFNLFCSFSGVIKTCCEYVVSCVYGDVSVLKFYQMSMILLTAASVFEIANLLVFSTKITKDEKSIGQLVLVMVIIIGRVG